MSRPERIEILGQPFTVKWEERPGVRLHEDSEHWMLGVTVLEEQLLVVRQTQAAHQLRDTLLHEVLHAIVGMTSQRDRFKPNDAHEKYPEEPVVASMATALLAVLRQNPHLVQWLVDEEPAA